LLIESRSNFLISFLVLSYLALRTGARKFKHVLLLLPVLLIIFYSLASIIQGNETLKKRFTLSDVKYQEKTSRMRIDYLELGIEDFISNPLGKGVGDIHVKYKGRTASIHNQFLTFVVSGGLVALLGLLLLTIGLKKVVIGIYKNQSVFWHRYLFATAIACMTFFVTLLFIEMSGLLLFLMISFLLFVEKEIFILDIGYEELHFGGHQ